MCCRVLRGLEQLSNVVLGVLLACTIMVGTDTGTCCAAAACQCPGGDTERQQHSQASI
jgi:hypothetical protein